MTGAYIDKDFVFQVARIRGLENSLLTKENFIEMSHLKSKDAVLSFLREKNIGNENDRNIESILLSERKNLWDLIDELVPDKELFKVFRMSNDYHNIKACIKEFILGANVENIYITDAIINVDIIKESIKNNNFNLLPDDIANGLKDIIDLFLKTKDSQLLDVMIDKMSLDAIYREGKNSTFPFIRDYVETFVNVSDIKIAVRAAQMKKSRDFLEKALSPCENLQINKLIDAAVSSIDDVSAYLEVTDYADAATAIKKSNTEFEKWCDDIIISKIQDMKYESFGIGPICAYIIAKENEIKMINIIYTCISNGFSEETILERMRMTYV